ncbi:apolipoprotein L4 [Homo sapiens]|uniref:APOL4 protein n=1 Tax=Homo sapiens TaxID=9606 RepID=Q9BRG6_HUMAN
MGSWVQLITSVGTSGLFLGVRVREEGAGMRCSKTIQAGQWLDSSKGPLGPSPPPVPTAGYSSSFCVHYVNLLPGVLVLSVTSQYPHLSMALCQLAAHDWPRLSCVCV